MAYIETYMNNMTVKNELGVNPEIDFKSCNMDVNQGSEFRMCWCNTNETVSVSFPRTRRWDEELCCASARVVV